MVIKWSETVNIWVQKMVLQGGPGNGPELEWKKWLESGPKVTHLGGSKKVVQERLWTEFDRESTFLGFRVIFVWDLCPGNRLFGIYLGTCPGPPPFFRVLGPNEAYCTYSLFNWDAKR